MASHELIIHIFGVSNAKRKYDWLIWLEGNGKNLVG